MLLSEPEIDKVEFKITFDKWKKFGPLTLEEIIKNASDKPVFDEEETEFNKFDDFYNLQG